MYMKTHVEVRGKAMFFRTVLFFVMFLFFGCKEREPFERSCSGETVPNCLPFEFSIVEMASVEPERISVDDPSKMADVHIEFARCERFERPHEVSLQLRTNNDDAPRIFDLITLRDDGQDGDITPRDGIIQKTIENPFFGSELPVNQKVWLRFRVRAPADCSSGTCKGGTCLSEVFEVPYEMGSRFDAS